MNYLTKLRDGFADGSTDRAQAENVLASFVATQWSSSACARG